MYTRFFRLVSAMLLLIIFLNVSSDLHAQVAFTLPANAALSNINRIEYYFDNDPGYGLGTSIAFTSSTDVTVTGYSVSITGLGNGVHHLFVRSRSVNGRWSATNNATFFIYNINAALSANSAITNIVKAEYFFDADPGFGLGTNIAITSSNDVTTTYAANITGLSNGVHRLYARTKNAGGRWSCVNNATFFIYNLSTVMPSNPTPANIVKAEYYFDADPGYGIATNIPITSSADVTASFAANITGLTAGVHHFYTRTKNAGGNWSTVNNATFFVVTLSSFPANPTTASVVKAEYYFDADPGYGHGTTISFAASQDVSGTYPINISGLSNGVHRIYFRTQNASGNWSATNALLMSVIVTTPTIPANSTPGNITKLEYFFDTDPGFGNGNTVTISPTQNLSNYTFAASLNGLSAGQHTLFIRTYDGWSATNSKSFFIGTPLPLTWLSFNAVLKNETVLLDWSTANEMNTAFFEIERSADGKQFDSIGVVRSHNEASDQYAFTDKHPLEGISYYRLKQFNEDGKFTYSVVLPIRFSNTGFAVYPNPSSDFIGLHFKQATNANAILLDSKGSVVRYVTLTGQASSRIDIKDIANGVYQLEVDENNLKTSEKIIVQH